MSYDFTRTGPEIQAIHDTVTDPSSNQSFTDAIGEIIIPKYTDVVYKGEGVNSAVDNMLADFSSNPLAYAVGTILSTGGTTWEYEDSTGTVTISNFRAFNSICVYDFGAVGDCYPETYSGTNDTQAIQAALDYAESRVLISAPSATDPDFGNKGGITVTLFAEAYLIDQIEIPDTVSFVGQGKNSTLLVSQFDGQIVRNKLTPGRGFDKLGTRISDFSIKGDVSKTNQKGLDTLRYFDNLIENISVFTCGGDALTLRQAITTTVRNVTTSNNIGRGIVIDGGINSWDDQTSNNLPSNANTISDCHSFANDLAGLNITGLANGNNIKGGSYENNYLSGGDNVGYNILIDAQSFVSNTIDGVWTEGPAEAHIFVNAATSSSPLEILNWKNIANGPTGHVDRALIVNSGTVKVSDSTGQAQSYASINGSIRPFRRNVASGNAILRVIDAVGSTITDGIYVEDESGNDDAGSQQENLNRAISGIRFDSTFKSSDSRVLDDYNEGTWTPTLETDGTDFDNVTYNTIVEGNYVKIGKKVMISGVMRTDSITIGSASGNVVIGGLPFVAGAIGTINIATSDSWSTNHPESGYILSSGNSIFLNYRTSANGPTSILPFTSAATGVNSNLMRFSGEYVAID